MRRRLVVRFARFSRSFRRGVSDSSSSRAGAIAFAATRYSAARVLPRETHDKPANLDGSRRPARTAMRKRPAARDQLPMPAQYRRRCHHERPLPRSPWQHPAERRQKRPISLRQLRTSDLTLQHPQLMAQQQDLDLLLPLRTEAENDQLEQPPQRPVEQRDRDTLGPLRHDRDPTRSDREPQTATTPAAIHIFGTHRVTGAPKSVVAMAFMRVPFG